MKVFKFGGACVQNPEAVRKIELFIRAEHHPLVLVFSAMGKTTQGLEEVFLQKIDAQPYDAAVRRLYRFHQDHIDQLLRNSRQEAYQALALWEEQLITTLAVSASNTSLDEIYSSIVAGGELLASKLIYYYLRERNVACTWVDARKCIKTHSGFRNAQVDWAATQHLVRKHINPLLEQKQVVLTQGFIGSNNTEETTTLGKEGSDFTGAILASVLRAQSLTIWKDVPGVMNADPRLFKKAIKFDRISYKTMAEMAFYGAKVVHPNTIQPLAAHNIPLYVKPFHHPHEPGTEISNGFAPIEHPIYILLKNQGLVQLSMNDLKNLDEACLEEILHQLTQQDIRANMLVKSACTLHICLNADSCGVNTLLEALAQRFKVHYQAQVSLLTVMHQGNGTLKTRLRQRTILLTQQRKGICQAVFQHPHKQEAYKQRRASSMPST
jgi:aspartate kinase